MDAKKDDQEVECEEGEIVDQIYEVIEKQSNSGALLKIGKSFISLY